MSLKTLHSSLDAKNINTSKAMAIFLLKMRRMNIFLSGIFTFSQVYICANADDIFFKAYAISPIFPISHYRKDEKIHLPMVNEKAYKLHSQ